MTTQSFHVIYVQVTYSHTRDLILRTAQRLGIAIPANSAGNILKQTTCNFLIDRQPLMARCLDPCVCLSYQSRMSRSVSRGSGSISRPWHSSSELPDRKAQAVAVRMRGLTSQRYLTRWAVCTRRWNQIGKKGEERRDLERQHYLQGKW